MPQPKKLYIIDIECREDLMSDAAKAAVPGIIRQFAQQLRARCGFVGGDAIKIAASAGGINNNGVWHEDPLNLEEEATHEDG